MGRTIKSKNKGVVSLSEPASSRSIRQKRVGTSRGQDGPSGGAQLVEHEHSDIPRRAEWTGGSLLKIHSHWQLNAFNEKMAKNSSREAGFQWEKEMTMDQFRLFGIVQKFEALGWEAALSCYDGESERLYLDDVQQWVGTLKMDPGRRPPKTMSLTGRAGGVDVTMSMETLNEIARFYSKPASQYSYPTEEELKHPEKQSTWDVMLDEIFLEGKGRGADKKKEELRVPARLLLTIVQQQVMPRKSDRASVRNPDVPILYSLIMSRPKISFRYLVMMNIWMSRNDFKRWQIPHVRLITALLKRHGAIREGSPFHIVQKKFTPWTLDGLNKFGWKYTRTERYHKLKHQGRKWRVLRPDARQLEPGERDEPQSDDSVMGESDGEDAEVDEGPSDRARAGVGSSMLQLRGMQFGFEDTCPGLDQLVQQARPSDYGEWPAYYQAIFDQNTRGFAQLRWDAQRNYSRQELWNRIHEYTHQREINHRAEDDRQRRLHTAWRTGQPVVENPPHIDYTSLPPYDGSVDYPVPPVHHSEWVDPHQERAQNQEEGRVVGAFGFGEFVDTLTSIFGPPQHRYH
ncbi:hypothetical protein HanXRQr2_Chr17g0829241 [Helianthus annuus]|nr:uncharacterized protein LOC110921890 [Helianthus annuus]KAF5757653.1 hypothetical protein HanXRQr2_Chr17g0829241 [Helianthus annuus]KAJ0815331.1 hypothetical protein HanPSC8_Chr17g0796291 [Helianthus annuus]